MADYTPDTPLLIGNEWAPIKFTPYPLDQSQEIGTSFGLTTASTVVSGSAYGVDMDSTPAQGVMLAVYPEGLVDQTGPIKQVVIQCNGATTAGTAGFFPTTTTAGDLASAYDNNDVTMVAAPGNDGTLTAYFDTLSHTELTGKRILNVELLYRFSSVGNGIDFFLANSTSAASVALDTPADTYGFSIGFDQQLFGADTDFINHPISSITFGDANPVWQTTPTNEFVYPWNYSALKLFDNATPAATRMGVALFVQSVVAGISYTLAYMALRVTYCEEQRLLVGGSFAQNWAPGRNLVQLRPPSLAGVGAALSAGRYAVTATRYDLIDPHNTLAGEMQINALTELYPMERQKGIIIPSTLKLGEVREAAETPKLVQLALHTSSASVPDVHPYGEQIGAPVWGSSTNPAKQGILSSSNGATTHYPYARFYARRSPETTAPLTLQHSTLTTISASITVADFDALPEIVDGWKQVDLTFASPTPSFNGSAGLETYQWVSTDTIGNQWQILSANAPAVTGSFPRTQLTSAQSLNAATYGSSTAFLTWNTVADPTADATLIFAQAMPAVSGLAISAASLAVTGIGLDCGVPPECIPSGISYNAVTWTTLGPSSVPASGFGYYELQRYDSIDAAWSTILHATSPNVTGFSDFEARIGMESRYRIRFMHRLLFAGAWSAEVAHTLPAPGVTGALVDSGVLVFTTNEVQSGLRSLGYAMQWQSEIVEGFTFIEAASRQLQQMYGRDFEVAFRPLERGGERFTRALLVQAAAVPSGLIQSGFTSLRDLAWEDVSYICVRDELSDRWLANVNVPDGTVRRNRRLYMANVDITEVTDTPSIVVLPDSDGNGVGEACSIQALWDQVPGWDYACWAA